MLYKHLWSIRLNFLISVFSVSSVVKYLIFSKLHAKSQLCNKPDTVGGVVLLFATWALGRTFIVKRKGAFRSLSISFYSFRPVRG